MDIRAYVDAVSAVVANETTSIAIAAEELPRWSKWALAAADRIGTMGCLGHDPTYSIISNT
jgi:hypothetical protein